MKNPKLHDTSDLLDLLRMYTARYTRNSYRGNLFRNYASLVDELLERIGDNPDVHATYRAQLRADMAPMLRAEVASRMERRMMHTEYAPVLPGGMVLEDHIEAAPLTNPGRLAQASREVTNWRYDDGTAV